MRGLQCRRGHRCPREAVTVPSAEAIKAADTLIHVLWINAGLSCDGDSVALTLTAGRVVVWGSADQAAAKARALAALLRQPGRRFDVSTPSVVTVR